MCIPEGQLHVETDICGTTGYVAPEYFFKVNEKTDLYSFGMPLLTLLIGWSLFLDGEYDTEAYYLVDWVCSCVEQN